MRSGPKSNRCGVTSTTPPGAPGPQRPDVHRNRPLQARTGTPWRDLPEAFGDGNAVSQRFRRWDTRTIWCHIKALFIDSTIVRAHQHTAGVPNKTADHQPRTWTALGGLSTKLHAACPDDRTGVSFVLSGGDRHVRWGASRCGKGFRRLGRVWGGGDGVREGQGLGQPSPPARSGGVGE